MAEGVVYRIEKDTRTMIYLKKQILIRWIIKKYPIRNIKMYRKKEALNSLEREGMRVRLKRTLALPELPRNPGQFNRRVYESGKKIDFYLENPAIVWSKEGSSWEHRDAASVAGRKETVQTALSTRRRGSGGGCCCSGKRVNLPGRSKGFFIRQQGSAMCLPYPVCISVFLHWRLPGSSDGWDFRCRYGCCYLWGCCVGTAY